MSARDDLRAWVTERATNADDAKRASGLIAAYVAESVRNDRAARARVEASRARIRTALDDVLGKMNDITAKATGGV